MCSGLAENLAQRDKQTNWCLTIGLAQAIVYYWENGDVRLEELRIETVLENLNVPLLTVRICPSIWTR